MSAFRFFNPEAQHILVSGGVDPDDGVNRLFTRFPVYFDFDIQRIDINERIELF